MLSHVQLFATPWSVACQAPLFMGILQIRILEWVAMPSSRDLPNPGIKPRSPTMRADSLPSEPPGKPKNTGIGSLSLLQGNFPNQELNQGLLHCRWTLYQLSYQGSPHTRILEWKYPTYSNLSMNATTFSTSPKPTIFSFKGSIWELNVKSCFSYTCSLAFPVSFSNGS